MKLRQAGPAAAVGLSAAAILTLFVATARYDYSGALVADPPRLTARHVADPRFAGATFQFEGRVASVRTLPSGIVAIRLQDAAEDIDLEASVFPSLGRLPVQPLPGQVARVTGSLGMYRGRPQLRPLSADHVEVMPPPPFRLDWP